MMIALVGLRHQLEKNPALLSMDLVSLRGQLQENPTLLSKRDDDGRSLLHYAVGSDQVEAVDLLVSLGAPLELIDNEGNTPLIIGTMENHVEVVRRLLKHGANTDTMFGQNDNTALSWAAYQEDHSEIVQLLINAGSSVNHQEKDGWTPLHVANNAETAQLLLDAKASLSIQDEEGNTPLHMAVLRDNSEVVMLLAPLSDLSLVGISPFLLFLQSLALATQGNRPQRIRGAFK